MLSNSLLATYAFDVFEPYALWITVGIIAALLIVGLVLYFTKRAVAGKYAKYASIGFALYALVLGLVMLALNIAKHADEDYLADNYVSEDVIWYVLVPLFILLAATLIFALIYFTCSVLEMNKTAQKVMGIVFLSVLAAGLIAVIVLIAVYYFQNIADDGYYNSDSSSVNQVVLYIAAALLIVVAVGGALLLGKNDKKKFDSRCIALAGVCIAMSFALSYIKLFELPQGGSVTLVSLLPLMIFAYVYGPKKGVLAGFIYGILQAVQDPYIIHPAQFLLDYPIAFAMIGFAGVFAGVKAIKLPQVRFALGAIVAAVLRFISHVISGVFAFSAYAGTTNVWVYSLAYNSFVFVDMALVIVVGIFVFSSKTFVRQMEGYATRSGAAQKEGTPDQGKSD